MSPTQDLDRARQRSCFRSQSMTSRASKCTADLKECFPPRVLLSVTRVRQRLLT